MTFDEQSEAVKAVTLDDIKKFYADTTTVKMQLLVWLEI
jgi:hypothetical protein